MRPSGVPVCLTPVQQQELGGPASVVDMVARLRYQFGGDNDRAFYQENRLSLSDWILVMTVPISVV